MTRRRPFGEADVGAPTGTESAALDRRAIEELGVPQAVLMENAGRQAADLVDHLFPEGEVIALVGKGNNGGDALVTLRTLAARGRPARAVVVGDRDEAGLLHGWPVERLDADGVDEEAWRLLTRDASVVVDGLLGTGIRGAAREPQAEWIRRMNAAGRPIVALDVPSGVDADRGTVEGDAVLADVTVAFGFPKLGTLLHPGRERAGRLVAVEIGFPPPTAEEVGARLLTPGWVDFRLPRRPLDTHKNEVGALLVVAGSEGMAGAALLAARAALRAGAGLLRIASPATNRTVLQTALPEAIFVDVDDPEALGAAADASTALLAGPGMGAGAAASERLERLLDLSAGLPAVYDADALNLAARGSPTLARLLEGRGAVLTPHPGEMGRLVGVPTGTVAGDRPGTAAEFAGEYGCVLLLKGTPSLVAAPGRPLLVDTAGSSDLAVGGAGDVLAGVIGSLLAQGVPARDAAGVALWTSGRAARLADRGGGLLPSDIVDHLPHAFREEGPGETELPLAGLLFDQDPPR